MRNPLFRTGVLSTVLVTAVWAAEEAGHGSEEFYSGLFAMVLIMVMAKLGAELFERFRQPGVLGEQGRYRKSGRPRPKTSGLPVG